MPADPRLLQFAFEQRRRKRAELEQFAENQRRAALEMDANRRKAQIEALEQSRKQQIHELELAKRRAELEAKLSGDVASGLSAAQDTASTLPTPSALDISGESGAQAGDQQRFDRLISQLDPAGVAAGRNAEQTLRDRLGTASSIRRTVSGTSPEASVRSAIGSAEVSRRQELKAIEDEFDKGVRNRIAKTQGDAAAARWLVRDTSNKRRILSRMERRGLDSGDLAEEIEAQERLLEAVGRDGQIRIQQIPGSAIPTQIAAISESDAGIRRVRQLKAAIDSGEIVPGSRGSVTSFVKRFSGVAQDILGVPEVPIEMKRAIAGALESTDGRVDVQVDEGKQLTLGLDQLALAWEYLQAKREGGRFTLLEFQSIINELGLTGLTRTPAQVNAALSKVLEANFQKKNRAATILRKVGVDPDSISSQVGLSPEQQAEIGRVGDFTRRGPASSQFVPTSDGGAAPPAPSPDRNALLEEARRIAAEEMEKRSNAP